MREDDGEKELQHFLTGQWACMGKTHSNICTRPE